MKSHILGKTGLTVSPLGLGTVEIGIADYGVGDKGLPSDTEAERFLKSAVEKGITYIDTARAYGVAEERIGKSGIAKMKDVVVGTKCAQFLEKGEGPRGDELERRIREDVEISLRTLQVDSLQLLQLHGGSKEQIELGELIEIMQKLKDEGKVQHAGIATRGEEAPLAAIKSGIFETLEVAYSVLDQRMDPQTPSRSPLSGGDTSPSLDPTSLKLRGTGKGRLGGVFQSALEHNIGIINRSVLLKGVLTPAYEKLPDALIQLKQHARKATKIADELGIDLPTLALRFVLTNPAVSTALIGTTKIQHIESAIAAVEAGPLPQDVHQLLYKLAINDPDLIDPARWPKETQTV